MLLKINKLKNKIQNRFYRLFGHSSFKKFIILGRSRTGSNLLVSFLSSHPNIICSTEIFGQVKAFSEKESLSSFFCKKKSSIKAVGFKIFYYHPLDKPDSVIWDLLKNDNSICVIHLTRNDKLRSVVSREIALKNKAWVQYSYKSNENTTPVRLDPLKTYNEISRTKNFEINYREKFKNHDILEITYEQLVKDRDNTLNSIFNFLEVKSISVKTDMVKQNISDTKNLVENYDEILKCLK